ncbi:hypothetical protein GCM10009720_21260 [Yaniella flava]|uniref:Uncharacterized protein n=1 Tax=Yaniella flava TaxID=287930 RepID=A0ABP5G5E8_9MICC
MSDLTPEQRKSQSYLKALEAWTWISRYASEVIPDSALGPIEIFAEAMGELSGCEMPLIDPASRAPVKRDDGSVVHQGVHPLGMSQWQIDRLSGQVPGGGP